MRNPLNGDSHHLDHLLPPQLGDLAVIEAELDQDLARVLAELRRAARNRAAAPAVGPYRELGVAALARATLLELWMRGRLARRHAEIDRHIVLFEQPLPFGRRLAAENCFQRRGQRIAIGTALGVAREALIGKLGHELYEVLPEVLFQYAERKALAVGRVEDIVHRKEMRSRVDLAIEAVAHRGQKKGRLEQRQIQVRAL